jgi:hypothetical protein
MIYPDNL